MPTAWAMPVIPSSARGSAEPSLNADRLGGIGSILLRFSAGNLCVLRWGREDQDGGISQGGPVAKTRVLDSLAGLPQPEDLTQFRKDIDPEWVEAALQWSGTATIRKRRLPAEQVSWLVIGMALFRNRGIASVANSLELALPSAGGKATAARSSVSAARDRLGEEPLAWLFVRCAEQWAQQSAQRDLWRGLALYGVDGTTLRVPDTDENRKHFGLASGGPRGNSGYPLVRLVAVMALRSHLIANAAFGPYDNGEYAYAAELWETTPDDSLTLVDKNFLSAALLLALQNGGKNRHWLLPAKSTTKWRRLKRLGRGDELVEMDVSSQARRKDPSLPRVWTARALRYQRKGFRPRTLLTSLVDPERYPAAEMIELYHERWEIELGYGEIKTDMLNATKQPLRSKTPQRIRQEIWGILIAYNLIRLEMERIADEANVRPTRISFVAVYRMICEEFIWCANSAPGAIPRQLRKLRADVKSFILPKRRSERSYPRAVKVKMSNYKKKRRPAANGQRQKGTK